MFRFFMASLALVAALLAAAPAASAGPEFNKLMRAALAGNERLVLEIRPAVTLAELNALKASSGTALGTAERVEGLLAEALPLAPDDASRSRVEGLMLHIRGTVDPLRMASQEASVDATQGRLNQARGEAEEALSEFVTFAAQLPAPEPEVLPKTGGLDDLALALAGALGLALCLSGLVLRVAASPRLAWAPVPVTTRRAPDRPTVQTGLNSPATNTRDAL
jgi:LPXTG-motif cell wall-anchored protein